MIKTIHVEIDDAELEEFVEAFEDDKAKIIQNIFENLEGDDGDVGDLLGYFCTGDLETYNEDPMVGSVTMHDELSGTIDVDFTGSAYYGCKDMDRLDEHCEAVAFEVSLLDKRITLTTEPPDKVERPPNEEF